MTGIPDKENFDFKETINFQISPTKSKMLVPFWCDLCISNIEYETHLDIYNRYTLYPCYWFAIISIFYIYTLQYKILLI